MSAASVKAPLFKTVRFPLLPESRLCIIADKTFGKKIGLVEHRANRERPRPSTANSLDGFRRKAVVIGLLDFRLVVVSGGTPQVQAVGDRLTRV